MRGTRYHTRLEPMERETLGNLAVGVAEALMNRVRSAPKDELAEMTGLPSGHSAPPQDPALARLLPSFFRDGDEEVDGEAALVRQFTETDIIRAKITNLRVVIDALGPDGSVNLSLSPEEVASWLVALTDLRTYFTARLDLVRIEYGDTSPEAKELENCVDWLGFNQDSLLTVLMGGLDLPDSPDEPGPFGDGTPQGRG